jgi:DnaJ family protein C protein 19
MPAALLLLIVAGLGWAWSTGRLKGIGFDHLAAGVLFLVALRLAATGRLLVGAALMAGALMWAMRASAKARPAAMPSADARALLGLGPQASLAEIREAHRRLIAKVHPDRGGSADLANQVNVARDTLVAEMNRKTPRAS